jgi:intracellular sulfur oxidation DsrE/DsrF family protein
MEERDKQEENKSEPQIDKTLTDADVVVNDDTTHVSYVTRVLAADSSNLNDVQRVRVLLHNSAIKVLLNEARTPVQHRIEPLAAYTFLTLV